MPEILARWLGARLAIAGDGHQRPEVRVRIRAHGLESQVHLLGRVGEAELRGWYRAADLTVTPMQQLEGFGLVIAESCPSARQPWSRRSVPTRQLVGDLHPLLVAPVLGPGDLAKRSACSSTRPDRRALRGRRRRPPPWSWPSWWTVILDLIGRP